MATDIHNTPSGVNAPTLPENLYPSRGFARLPQRMSLEQEWALQIGIARRAVDRAKELHRLISGGSDRSPNRASNPTIFPLSQLHAIRYPDGSIVEKVRQLGEPIPTDGDVA